MAPTVNIRRDVTDPFYRYKMERLQSKIEGKGNGIKTVIVNLPSVAQSLARPPSYVIKYFGFELGAQTNDGSKDDRWIINGAHDASKLQDYLDGFISRFVLCKNCKNPETDVIIKDQQIVLDCKACGQRSTVDARLKLAGFIIKNQPKKGKKDKSTKKADRKARKEAESRDQENGSGNGSPIPGESGSDDHDAEDEDFGIDAGSDDELTRRINKEAEQINGSAAKEIQWSVDTSEEAVKARAQELPDDLKRALVVDDEEDGEGGGSAYDQLGNWISETAKELGSVKKVDSIEVFRRAKELGIESKHRTLTVLAMTLFDENIVAEIEARAPLLKKMMGDSDRHQKAFLGGTERFVGQEKPSLTPKVSAILMQYHNFDVVDDEVLKAWCSKASKKYVDLAVSKKVRKAAEPFLQALENLSDDEESDSE